MAQAQGFLMKNFLRKLTGFNSKSLEKGFSLAEIMVSVAILGIVITATVSQLKLSSKSATDMAADAEINNITNKIISAIGTTAVCGKNFAGQVQNASYNELVDINLDKLIVKGNMTGPGGEVKVQNIETKMVSDNEMVLVLSFQKKRFGVDMLLGGPKREIPINTILQGGPGSPIEYCFANYDLVIKTAVQQACKGATAYYNPNRNPPYGVCEHIVKPLSCAPGEFLKKVTANASKQIEFECGKVSEDCPEGQAVSGFDSAGKVICQTIFPSCAAGEVLMKIGGAFACKRLDCGVATQTELSAFRGFDSSGGILCTKITTPGPCPNGQYTTQIDNTGKISCSASPFVGGSCGVGKYINGVNSDGSLKCDSFITLPFDCPVDEAITGIKSDGTPDCEKINTAFKCAGSTRTYNDCRAYGGEIIKGANSHCKFNGSTCPAPWTRCNSIGAQWEVGCRDTSNTFYCNQWTQYRSIAPWLGSGPYGDQGLRSVSCLSWVGTPGTQGRCDAYAGVTLTTRQDTVGCK